MIDTAATLTYDHIPAIVLPVSERQNPYTNSLVTIPPYERPITTTTIEYGVWATHFSKLKKIEAEPSLWPSNTDRPSADSLGWANLILRQLVQYNFPPTRVVASAEGGTAVCFVDGDKYADIESLNSGVILGVLSDNGNRPLVWEVEQNAGGIARAVDRVREFINSP